MENEIHREFRGFFFGWFMFWGQDGKNESEIAFKLPFRGKPVAHGHIPLWQFYG